MLALFRRLAPEFACDADSVVLAFVALAETELSPSAVAGAARNVAVVWLAAHRLAMSARGASEGGSSVGAVTSRAAGGVSVGYAGAGLAAKDAREADLMSTTYGIQLLGILNTRAARIGIV